jgi:hypothetical protein
MILKINLMIEEGQPFDEEFIGFVFLDQFKVCLQHLLQSLILSKPTLSEAEEDDENYDVENTIRVSVFLFFFVMPECPHVFIFFVNIQNTLSPAKVNMKKLKNMGSQFRRISGALNELPKTSR